MMSSMKLKLFKLLIIFVLLMNPLRVNAHVSRNLNPTYRIWTDTVEVTRNKNDFKLVSEATGENQTTNIVDYQTYNLSRYPGIVIDLKTDKSIKFNIIFKSDNEYRYQEDDTLLIINEETKLISRLSQSFGVYTIEGSFNGRLYLPLSKYNANLSNTEFWSMILVQNANEELNISFNSIKLLTNSDIEWYESQLNANVIQENEVQIPVQGESMLVLPKIENSSYELLEPYDGVRLEYNRLILSKNTKEGFIKLAYIDSDGYKSLYPIKTYLSWIIDEKTDGVNIAFPETSKNLKQMFDQWFDVKYTKSIQIGIGVVFVGFILFYRYKRNKRRVKKDVVQ